MRPPRRPTRARSFEVDDDLYYAQFHHDHRPDEAVTLILDLRSGYSLGVVSVLGDAAPGKTAVQHLFALSRIEELAAVG